MRPSTLLRIERLTALIAAFSERDLRMADVAGLLGCSASAARNYTFELADAGVIRCAPCRQADGGVDRTLFGITPDRALVNAFVSVLMNPRNFDVTRASAGREPRAAQKGALGDSRRQEAGSVFNAVPVVAQRDPLVAALFGSGRAMHHSTP